jgi:hypothetical protein
LKNNGIKIKKLIYILLILLSSLSLKSQGFDWQFDSRMPFKSPVFFYGLTTEYGLLSNTAKILFSEAELPCCTFQNGQGYQFSLGAHAEYWENSNLAYSLDFILSNKNSVFNGNSDTLPLRTGEQFISRYEFTSNINNIIIEPSIKYRILNTHFNVNAGLQLGFQYVATSEQNEYVVAPSNWSWKSKKLSSSLPFDLNLIVINPKISIGYDYSLADGMYLTPSLSYNFPLLSIASGQNWRYQSVIFRVTFNYGAFLFID